MNKFPGVGSFNLRVSNTSISETADFFDVGLDVEFGVWAFDEVPVFQQLASGWVDDGVYEVISVKFVGLFKDSMIAGW